MAGKAPMVTRATSLALVAALVATGTVALSGCTSQDTRVAAIDQAIQAAVPQVAPGVVGVLTGDIATALKNAGDATKVMVPVLVADLNTGGATVTAKPDTTGPFDSVADAAQMLGDSGRVAWQAWYEGHRDDVEYVATDIPVTLATTSDKKTTVAVDKKALEIFLKPFAVADTKLFVKTVEALPEWRRQMVAARVPDMLAKITGLPQSMASDLASVDSIEPASDGAFTVSVSAPDPVAVAEYQATEAAKSYGSGKIWGGVSKGEFESRMADVTDIPSDVGPPVTTQATVTVEATGDGDYSETSAPLSDILAKQVNRYQVTLQSSSAPDPASVSEARAKAESDAIKSLDKQVIKKQSRPGTKRLVGGGSGQSLTVKSNFADLHVTFFKWGTKTQTVSVFVQAGKSLKFRIPLGTYRVVFAAGATWYGPKYSFGPSGTYSELKSSPSSTSPLKYVVKRNYYYTLTFGTPSGNIGGGGIDNPYEK